MAGVPLRARFPSLRGTNWLAVALLAFVLMGVSNSGKALLVLIFGARDQYRCH